MPESAPSRPSRAKQLLTVLLACGLAAYGAISGAWAPLFSYLTVVSALVAIGAGHRGEARYGRRVPVTEMLPLGRQGDRDMLWGGMAGYLMAVFAVAAGVALYY